METGIKKLVTHDGSFHADDIFACAVLVLLLEKNGISFEVLRTRDEEIIKKADFVFDVGGVHDPEQNRFDHHQHGGAGKRENGIEYASFGLVWKKFGPELCGAEEVAIIVERDLVTPIDAGDNGQELFEVKNEVFPYLVQNAFSAMVRTWREDPKLNDKYFLDAVEIAKKFLERKIIWVKDAIEAETMVTKSYQLSEDKRIIILDKDYPFDIALNNFPEPLFVIHQRATDGFWAGKSIRDNIKTFKNRKDFPESWAGLRNEDLQKVSGVSDAVFCHRGLFLVVVKSKEGAIKLAQIALES